MDRANVANKYTYDVNGNLTKDLNKNITSISYNALNLPNVITFTDGNTIAYGYDAAGSKLSVAYKSGSTTTKTEYVGNKVYKNGTLSMILTQEGYLTLAGTTPTYYYYLKDHQGNNRVVINQSGAVQQVNHYYPFGGLFGEGIQTANQPYKYNGKELDRFQGVDVYDHGARHYDAALGRTTTVDPMAEKYYSFSQYVYCANNPVRFVDPTGMFYEDPPAFPMTEAYLKGLWSGVSGGVDMIIHPKRTFNNLKAAVTDPTGTIEAIGNSLNDTYQAVKSGDGEKIASVTGNVLGGLAFAEGAVKVVSGVSRTTSVTNTIGELSSTGIKAGTNAAKTGGRLGNAATRSQIDNIATALESRGYTITGGGGRTAEEFLKPLGGGRKGGSFLDITATHPNYPTLRINTVDVYKNGFPTLRELNNAARIRTQITQGEHLLLIPKR